MTIFRIEPQRIFYYALCITLLIKIMLGHFLPITGDEAYFVFWGKHPDYGYYDHPPMVGWLLSVLLLVSDAVVWLRMPAIVFTSLIAWLIYRLLRSYDPIAGSLVALLYLVTPVNLVGTLITTDIPLLLWAFLSGVCFYYAQKSGRAHWYVLTGVFLGLSFLSKFFAVLLGLAYAIYILLFNRSRWRSYIGLLYIILAVMPFIALNLVWNYNHCWDNYLFNLYNRISGAQFSLRGFGLFLFLIVYLVTPPVLYFMFKKRQLLTNIIKGRNKSVYLGLFIIPMFIFAFLSTYKSIGLHWLLSFYPFLIMSLAFIFDIRQLRLCLYFMLPFCLIHITIVVAIVAMSPQLFAETRHHTSIVIGTHADEILNAFAQHGQDYMLATDSYAFSAALGYHSKQHVMVFGEGSYHGRQDDLITDFRTSEGHNIIIVSDAPAIKSLAVFFDEAKFGTKIIQGAQFYYLEGRGFIYNKYKDNVLEAITRKYYTIPSFLPHAACYMQERYF